MPKLHPVVNDTSSRLRSGICALATITGFPLSMVRRNISKVRERRGEPTAVWVTRAIDIQLVLKELGWKASLTTRFAKGTAPTIAAWLRAREDRAGMYLLYHGGTSGNRWGVVSGNKFCDAWQTEPVFLSDIGCRRSRVHVVYRVEAVDPVRYKASMKPKRQPGPSYSREEREARDRTKALLTILGGSYERSQTDNITRVYPPNYEVFSDGSDYFIVDNRADRGTDWVEIEKALDAHLPLQR